jgi:hypothetical protein
MGSNLSGLTPYTGPTQHLLNRLSLGGLIGDLTLLPNMVNENRFISFFNMDVGVVLRAKPFHF